MAVTSQESLPWGLPYDYVEAAIRFNKTLTSEIVELCFADALNHLDYLKSRAKIYMAGIGEDSLPKGTPVEDRLKLLAGDDWRLTITGSFGYSFENHCAELPKDGEAVFYRPQISFKGQRKYNKVIWSYLEGREERSELINALTAEIKNSLTRDVSDVLKGQRSWASCVRDGLMSFVALSPEEIDHNFFKFGNRSDIKYTMPNWKELELNLITPDQLTVSKLKSFIDNDRLEDLLSRPELREIMFERSLELMNNSTFNKFFEVAVPGNEQLLLDTLCKNDVNIYDFVRFEDASLGVGINHSSIGNAAISNLFNQDIDAPGHAAKMSYYCAQNKSKWSDKTFELVPDILVGDIWALKSIGGSALTFNRNRDFMTLTTKKLDLSKIEELALILKKFRNGVKITFAYVWKENDFWQTRERANGFKNLCNVMMGMIIRSLKAGQAEFGLEDLDIDTHLTWEFREFSDLPKEPVLYKI